MAIFNKDTNGTDPKTTPANGDATLSVIAFGSKVIGDMECSGVLKIEGTVEGTVRGARQVLLGRQGIVKGDIETREAVIGGQVEGSILALERVEIQGTASVVGNVNTKTIVIREGGQINGAVRMQESPTMAREKEHRPQPVAVVR